MTETPKTHDVEPTVLEEPGREEPRGPPGGQNWDPEADNVWLRGVWMVLFAVFFGVAEALLWVLAIVQFLWLLFAKEKNRPIADFGEDMADWVARIARFQTGATEDRPFPFARWGKAED